MAKTVKKKKTTIKSKSEPNLSQEVEDKDRWLKIERKAISLPSIPTCRKHPLLDDVDDKIPHTHHELLFAAETLENIVNEGAFVGTVRSRFKWLASEKSQFVGREISDRVLKLFLDSLGLAKIMLFDLMRHHFDYKSYPGINYELSKDDENDDEKYQKLCIDLVKDLEDTFRSFQIKFSAAYARLRIELGARGENFKEQLENVLPDKVRQKEEMASDILRTLRINELRCDKSYIEKVLREKGYKVELEKLENVSDENIQNIDDLIFVDDDFEDLLIIPPSYYAELKASPLVSDGYLIFQDKASMYCPSHLRSLIKPGANIIDARSGCGNKCPFIIGTKIAQLSALVGPKGIVYAFENRQVRLETLRARLDQFGCKNVVIVEEDFSTIDVNDDRFEKVSLIIVEPINSGTNIVDKLGYMLQEEEYPVDNLTQKDLYTLKRQQTAVLKHAFKFPKVRNIIYMTRSNHTEENEQVVQDALDRYGVDWELNCVLPDISIDQKNEYELEQCLTIRPADVRGNGIFIANFHIRPTKRTSEIHEDIALPIEETANLSINKLEDESVPIKKTRKSRKQIRQKGEKMNVFLPKLLRDSVSRLAVPRSSLSKAQKIPTKELPKPEINTIKSNSEVNINKPAEISQKVEVPSEVDDFSDIGIYGISLKKFFGPRAEALKVLDKFPQKISYSKPRWIYPVPNPTKWK